MARLVQIGRADMIILRIIGALLALAGIVYMAMAAIKRGKLSDPGPNLNDTVQPTLEPRRRGMRFLGLSVNWPGIALFVSGLALIVLSWLLAPPPPA
jgi:hypothetical protein